MEIEEFALATWLNEYETDVEFNLASSTGPLWTAKQLLELEGDTETGWAELARVPLNYVHAAGTRELRRAVADFYDGAIDPQWVQVTTGAAEALWLVLFHVCVRGANVIVPHPCYPALDGIPRALGAEDEVGGSPDNRRGASPGCSGCAGRGPAAQFEIRMGHPDFLRLVCRPLRATPGKTADRRGRGSGASPRS